jgi:FkbM family methyltransferase
MNIFTIIAQPLIGSGIGRTFPWLHDLYRKLYNRQPKTNITVTLPNGYTLNIPNDTGPGLFLASTGTYEPLATKYFTETIKPTDTIFDIGAHVGYYTLLGAKNKVVAFEPAPDNLVLLRQNIERNNLTGHVKIVPWAVSDTNGRTLLYLSDTSSGDHSLNKKTTQNVITVQTITIDGYTKTTGIFPTIMKIDVEGAEYQVLKGMNKTLRKRTLRTVFIELNGDNPHIDETVDMLQNTGFQLHILDEKRKQLAEGTRAAIHAYIKTFGYVNILAKR